MDIKQQLKGKIDEIVEKIKSDKEIAARFQKEPIATVESLVGIKLPKDQLDGLVDAVKAKVNLDKLGGALGSLFGKK